MTTLLNRAEVVDHRLPGQTVPALFVTHATALSTAPGGLQICTREYRDALRLAGLALTDVTLAHDRRLKTRLRRRLSFDRYPRQWHPSAVDMIVGEARRIDARVVFLNLVNLAPLATVLRPRLNQRCRLVLLSHGLESVDYVHFVRARRADTTLRARWVLGRTLLQESKQRRDLDHVFCLTSTEAELERWLGAASVSWLPRTIPARPPLRWSPRTGRIGFVGTLDHQPNGDGLAALLQSIAQTSNPAVQVRIVGGPPDAGERIASRSPCATYLGPLDDRALEAEASTWACFVHPLFCYARGCSTKLATAISWQIPIATTTAGRRGYTWTRGDLPVAESPDALAALAIRLAQPTQGALVRPAIAQIVESAPRIEDVAGIVRTSLAPLVGAVA